MHYARNINRSCRSVCREYDFEGDAGWRKYSLSLTFPPGRPDLVRRYQARWFQREVEPSLNIDEVAPRRDSSTATAKSTPPERPPVTPPPAASRRSVPTPLAKPFGIPDAVGLLGHLLLVLLCIAAVQPFDRYISQAALLYFVRTSVIVHAGRLIRKLGFPAFSMAALKPWLLQAAASTEFFYITSALVFGSNPAAWVGLVPMAVLAVYHASATLSGSFGGSFVWHAVGGAAAHRWLASQQEAALEARAVMEIGALGSIALSAFRFGPRTLLTAYIYANQLRFRYWSPESRPYQINAWRQLSGTIQPVLRYLPVLQRVITAGKAWFEAAGRRV